MSNVMKATVRAAPVQRAPRYSVRLRNGVHQVFDGYHYAAVEAFERAGEAQAAADYYNRLDSERRRP